MMAVVLNTWLVLFIFKDKFISVCAIKAWKGIGGTDPLILNFGIMWRPVFSLKSHQFHFGENGEGSLQHLLKMETWWYSERLFNFF
jgi:hypothetical protein